MATLRVKVDPTGAVTGANQAENALEGLQTQAVQTEAATNRLGKSMGRGGAMSMGIQNASYQVGDFAVQIAGGTSAMRAASMQLPQLLGGFGVWGAVAGAVTAIMGALIPVLFNFGDGADSAADAVERLADETDALSSVMSNTNAKSVDKLKEKYGEITREIETLIERQRQLTFDKATRAAEEAADKIAEAMSPSFWERLRPTQLIGSVADWFNDISPAIRELMETFDMAEGGAKLLSVRLRHLEQEADPSKRADLYASIISDLEMQRSISGDLNDEAHEFYENVLAAEDSERQLVVLVEQLEKGFAAAADEAERLAVALPKPTGVAGGRGAALPTGMDILMMSQGGEWIPGKDDSKEKEREARAAAAELERIVGAYESTRAALDKSYRATKQYRDAVETLDDALRAGKITQDEYNEVLVLAQERLADAEFAATDLGEAYNSVADTIESSMESAFMSLVDGTMSAKDAFRSMARDIIAEAYRMMVVRPIINGLFGGGGGGGQMLSSFFGGGGNFFGSLFGARANGGPVATGEPYLVGERGPELFVPSSSGNIQSNRQMGGSVVNNYSYTFTGGVTEKDLRNAIPAIVEASTAAVLNKQQRGGTYARAF